MAAKLKGGLKGGLKPKKFALTETKPSPMGRRVEPRIDSAMKAKVQAAAAAAKRRKGVKFLLSLSLINYFN